MKKLTLSIHTNLFVTIALVSCQGPSSETNSNDKMKTEEKMNTDKMEGDKMKTQEKMEEPKKDSIVKMEDRKGKM